MAGRLKKGKRTFPDVSDPVAAPEKFAAAAAAGRLFQDGRVEKLVGADAACQRFSAYGFIRRLGNQFHTAPFRVPRDHFKGIRVGFVSQ